MLHTSHMKAMNAARKQFGKTWQSKVLIEKVGHEQFSVQLKHVIVPETCLAHPSETALLTEHEGAWAFPTAALIALEHRFLDQHIAEQRANQQAFFNSRTIVSDAAEASEVFGDDELEDAQKLADKIANNAVIQGSDSELAQYLLSNNKCPKCGSEEVFTGWSDKGLVVDDDRVGGCHHCDFSFDFRKPGKTWVHQSTILKPTKQVWHIADEMIDAARAAGHPAPSRKEVQEECVRRGVASGTARTQYQAWKKANDESRANQSKAAEASKRFNGK